jgi:signal transduction histidine kinase
MSHEIRTPLNSIVGFSNLMLEDECTNEEKQIYTQYINKSCDSLLHLINDILDLSKIESKQITLTESLVNIKLMVQEIFTAYESEKTWFNKKDIELKLSIPAIEIHTITDPMRTEQVIRNLITNAFKYTDKGIIEIGLYIEKKDVVIYVKDTGIGIPEDKLNMVFDRFVKLEEDHSRLFRGVGLGLSICSKLAEMLNGKLWVTSELNIGSTFYFSLPIKKDF